MSEIVDAGSFAKGGTVVLASLEGYWDALTAAGIAGLENAPVVMALQIELGAKSAEVIGYPECRINLAQAATYIALAPKSNACEAGIDAALAEVRHGPVRSVPDYLRDRHRPGSENYGAYKYPHNFPGGWVEQRYLPEGLERGCFYHPSERGWEAYRIEATSRDRNRAE